MWAGSHKKPIPFVSGLIYNNHMRTIEELVNEIYEDNYSHIEFDENMGGEECDCHIHTTLNTIVHYWWDK